MLRQTQATDAYLCPICESTLLMDSNSISYACSQDHRFDIAKEGYLNLLPVQFKHSAEPGDSKAMIASRRAFLEAGFYDAMANAVTTVVKSRDPDRLLDLACGEGFYSRKIQNQCLDTIELHGIDIAKHAVRAAAKKQPGSRFIVASVNKLPYVPNYFDFVVRIFGPCSNDEIRRVLKPGGYLLTVTPGPRHLWQLKEFIYDDVREHALENTSLPGFELIESQRINYPITPSPEQRLALLQMTPFAWRADEKIRQAIKSADNLAIETDFVLTLSQHG